MVKFGVWIASLGAVIFVASFMASGMHYRISETAGQVTDTPGWILMWHVVGLATMVIGVVVFAAGAIRESQQRGLKEQK